MRLSIDGVMVERTGRLPPLVILWHLRECFDEELRWSTRTAGAASCRFKAEDGAITVSHTCVADPVCTLLNQRAPYNGDVCGSRALPISSYLNLILFF